MELVYPRAGRALQQKSLANQLANFMLVVGEAEHIFLHSPLFMRWVALVAAAMVRGAQEPTKRNLLEPVEQIPAAVVVAVLVLAE